jgi:hypothetical protein
MILANAPVLHQGYQRARCLEDERCVCVANAVCANWSQSPFGDENAGEANLEMTH